MKLDKDYAFTSINEYVTELSSDAPSPGGGSAAALCAVLGASLVEMVARMNVKRAKKKGDDCAYDHLDKISNIRQQLMALITQDVEVFLEVSKYWKTKGAELQQALKVAADVPYNICQGAHQLLGLAQDEIDKTPAFLMSDLSECGLLLKSAIESAWMNVEINLRAIEDSKYVEDIRVEYKQLKSRADELSEQLIHQFNKEAV